ncbi:p-cresol methylhydroxylase subunit [Novosphingobium sp. Rr 2-17]|uniref:c-type cytochrome n=1 Tax=Novosphingobium sp. Rr 2-17 TaxID=555793 RepID=UPI0002699ECF|nr:cytochrome c [Novosphingobium sp. Rr 2-17]EIZ79127.1 p-cresol methylhydroxylase subunit [Novosphingobium sp. Rr 2-17]
MSKPALYAVGLGTILAIATVAAVSDDVNAESKPGPVYESSIGGVVGPSNLPGAQGQGYLVYSKWCSGCHAPEYVPAGGKEAAAKLPVTVRLPLGTNLLQQRYQGSVPAALEERTDLTPEVVRTFVRSGINGMPPFRKTEISDADLDALGAYLSRNTKAP